jgi:hypothetical protein
LNCLLARRWSKGNTDANTGKLVCSFGEPAGYILGRYFLSRFHKTLSAFQEIWIFVPMFAPDSTSNSLGFGSPMEERKRILGKFRIWGLKLDWESCMMLSNLWVAWNEIASQKTSCYVCSKLSIIINAGGCYDRPNDVR